MLQKRAQHLLRDATRGFAIFAAVLLLIVPSVMAQDTTTILSEEAASVEEAGPRVRPVRTRQSTRYAGNVSASSG